MCPLCAAIGLADPSHAMLGKLRAVPAGELVGFAATSVGSWLVDERAACQVSYGSGQRPGPIRRRDRCIVCDLSKCR
jgi:hypothetical protein